MTRDPGGDREREGRLERRLEHVIRGGLGELYNSFDGPVDVCNTMYALGYDLLYMMSPAGYSYGCSMFSP